MCNDLNDKVITKKQHIFIRREDVERDWISHANNVFTFINLIELVQWMHACKLMVVFFSDFHIWT